MWYLNALTFIFCMKTKFILYILNRSASFVLRKYRLLFIPWIVALDNSRDCNFLPVGVTVNSRCRPKMSNTTALHLAATGGCQPILDLLLQNEADPLAVDLLGATPLHKAVEQQNIPGVKCLLSLYV